VFRHSCLGCEQGPSEFSGHCLVLNWDNSRYGNNMDNMGDGNSQCGPAGKGELTVVQSARPHVGQLAKGS
jgi:hypothetical protein